MASHEREKEKAEADFAASTLRRRSKRKLRSPREERAEEGESARARGS